MNTTSEKLNYLLDTKTAIKNALIEKGASVEDTDTFRSYADKILSLQIGSGGSSDTVESEEMYIQDTEPNITSSPAVWLDTSDGSNILKIHNGTKWITVRGTWA